MHDQFNEHDIIAIKQIGEQKEEEEHESENGNKLNPNSRHLASIE